MSANPTSNRLHPFWDTLTIVLFLALLWLPTLDYFFKFDHTPTPNENRLPAQWPHFTGLAQGREFITGVENYFNDHFGFRNRLIRWDRHWKNLSFRTTASQDVLVGHDGWLFYTGERMFEHWNRRSGWTEQDLRDWRQLLELRRDWLRERGIKYIFVVPPDKHTVYPEYLPDWMEKSSKPSKLQQLAEYMKAHSDVEFIDLTQTLIDAKKIRVNYLKTDTHWNAFGGFVAYRTLVQRLSHQIPGLEPLPLDAYEWKSTAHPRGDLIKLDGKDNCKETTCEETEGVTPIPLKPIPPLTEMIYDSARLPRRQGDPDQGPSCYTHICHTQNDKASGKALVFRDSFGGSWGPLLGLHFKDVIYIWAYNWDRVLIESEKPDVVIDEILERFFNIQDPAELLRREQLSATSTVPP